MRGKTEQPLTIAGNYLDMVAVTGSIPVAPTSDFIVAAPFRFARAARRPGDIGPPVNRSTVPFQCGARELRGEAPQI